MRCARLHTWSLDLPHAKALQARLAARVEAVTPRSLKPRLIAGADLSHRRGSEWLYGAVVVLAWPGLEVVETATARRRASFPYVPGYLSFREGPVLLDAFRKLKQRPDLVCFDGHGYAHPRRFGLACHLGLWLDLPTLGVAKSRLVGTHAEPPKARGSAEPLFDGAECIGTVLRTRPNAHPLYVSVGHRIGLEAAADWALLCTRPEYRLPEPTRQAHAAVNAYRKSSELDK